MNRLTLWITAVFAGFALCATVAWAEDGKVPKGQTIFLKYRCKSCHSIKAIGIEKKAEAEDEEASEAAKTKDKPPDLSGVGTEHGADWFAKWLLKKETKDGKTHKKRFRGTEAELKTVTEWLATLKTDEAGKPKKAATGKAPAAAAPAAAAPAEKGSAASAPAEKVLADTLPILPGGK